MSSKNKTFRKRNPGQAFGAKDSGPPFLDIPLDLIDIDPNQPRKAFDTASLTELSQTIKEVGVQTPITVSKQDNDRYILRVGERRFRASGIAGKDTIPAVIKDIKADELLLIQWIENDQRDSLNVFEKAETLLRLKDEYETWPVVQKKTGMKPTRRKQIVNALKLPESMREGIRSEADARALLLLQDDKKGQSELYKAIRSGDISGREAIRKAQSQKKKQSKIDNSKLNDLVEKFAGEFAESAQVDQSDFEKAIRFLLKKRVIAHSAIQKHLRSLQD